MAIPLVFGKVLNDINNIQQDSEKSRLLTERYNRFYKPIPEELPIQFTRKFPTLQQAISEQANNPIITAPFNPYIPKPGEQIQPLPRPYFRMVQTPSVQQDIGSILNNLRSYGFEPTVPRPPQNQPSIGDTLFTNLAQNLSIAASPDPMRTIFQQLIQLFQPGQRRQ